jgi:Zn-finger protein
MQSCSDTVYISLGHDCATAYAIQMNHKRHNSYPFDWIRWNNISGIVDCIENKCQFLFDTDYITFDNNYKDMFPSVNENWNDNITSSKTKIINSKYSCILPHENLSLENTIDMIKEKYDRRIKRFYEILSKDSIKKIFIRLTNKDEDIKDLERVISVYSNNFEIRNIYYDKKTKYSSWKKEELDWENILL